MSSGSFVQSKYESDRGSVHQIKLQPETVFASVGGQTNDPPSSVVNSPFAAEVNRGAKSYGLRPRYVNVAFKDTPPTGYQPYTTLKISILDPDTFSLISTGDAVTYNGGTGAVTSKAAESILPGDSAIGQDNDTPVEGT